MLGMGRGDSSVQRIGKREDKVARFARYLDAVQRYLRGEAVDRDGFASRLEWLPHVKAPKVPLCVAATGPRVIEVAARHADRRLPGGRRRSRPTSATCSRTRAQCGRARRGATPTRCATAPSSTA